MKRILYDMGNFFDANRPSYGLIGIFQYFFFFFETFP